jgi:ATP-binding cassette subfamily C protein
MIASSILLGRALSPVETVVNQWSTVQRAKRGWDSLVELLATVQTDSVQVELPRPRARIDVQQVTVIPPNGRQATLRLINFQILPGEAVGIIGPSGSGKSTLARALTGVWPLSGGKITLDGAPLNQYHPAKLAQYIGYLPQKVSLFDGTVAENIARLSTEYDDERVVAAAKKAAAHEMILKLSQGYNTPLHAVSTELSGGQIQRLGLARALYSDPVLLVLDEPNSNLDNDGSQALNQAIRAMKASGRSVLIMAHRPAAIQECDTLLVLDGGVRVAFGPKDEVLKGMVKNHQEIRQASTGAGGVA